MTDTTITVARRDANHAAFALRRQALKWRKLAVTAFSGEVNGFTQTLVEQADAVDRVAQAIEDREDA